MSPLRRNGALPGARCDWPFVHLVTSYREIVGGLQVHPEFGGIPEISRQKQGRLRRDAAFPANQFVHPVQRDPKRPSQIGLG